MVELNNRRVAKNALMLSMRMVLVAIVGLYTSRIVLKALGVDDYGLYGLVGGIVGMVSFLNGAMGGATSRFITFEIGTGNMSNLGKVFSTSFLIHVVIAVFAVIIAETVGLWFLHHKLVIPDGKMFAANIVFQLSIVSMAISFTQVPYSAMIIAYERMNIYAYFEIISVILKLGIVYMLLLVSSERLILYSFLMFGVSLLSALFYRWYCVRNFKESRLNFNNIDRKYTKKMLTFSGYDLYGNMSVMVYLQGLPIVLNLFLGVVANAASSIGMTVTGTVKGFAWSVSSAFTPQITKQYAAGNIENMEKVMCRSIMFTVLTFAIFALPFYVETERVLFLWLGQLPKYSVVFLRLIMIVTIVDYITMSNNRGIHATGNIRSLSLISGSFYLVCPFIAYLLMKNGGPAYTPYVVNTMMLIIVSCLGFYLLKKQIKNYNIRSYILLIIRTYAIVIVCGLFLKLISEIFIEEKFPVLETSFWESIVILAFIALLSALSVGSLSYYFILNVSERSLIRRKISGIVYKYKS